MSMKVKRGAGLVVVALIVFLIGYATSEGNGPSAFTDLLGVTTVLIGAIGLVLVAWGLLRD